MDIYFIVTGRCSARLIVFYKQNEAFIEASNQMNPVGMESIVNSIESIESVVNPFFNTSLTCRKVA